ncbi:MAG TPA: isoprenylcysteine carboxylmethyltransferase family protein [Candidatus Dormibacteraeota bacterium]|nr:isoprenylcysteine carboxylmethyltransferase family protein [Candidatus Dormibacteraeota bacterium]
MVATDVKTGARGGAYWRELLLGRVLPALFFSVFVADQILQLSSSVQGARTVSDYLFVIRQVLALAYFTMLVVLYSTRQPARGTDHRLTVILVAFTGTFSAIVASFLPGGVRREALILPGDILATVGLAYSVWGLAYLRRSFSIVPEARRLVTGGPYAFSRHPVYVGEIATAIGVNLATAGWAAGLAVVYFVGAELLRMRWEERILSQTFPNEYPAYAARVPRYLPNPFRR